MRNSSLFCCVKCGGQISYAPSLGGWSCNRCAFTALGTANYLDLLGSTQNETSDHYSKQWGEDLGFLKFVQKKPEAKSVMPAARLGWDTLFASLREQAQVSKISIYDAACGFGGLANEIIREDNYQNIRYLGADIHGSLQTIPANIQRLNDCGDLIRWDVSEPPPALEKFDYVLCRAAVHHTPSPQKTFSSLCSVLKPGGKIAISVYRKKGVCREANDDALRKIITAIPADEAFAVCRQFTILGRALQDIKEKVQVSDDLPLLGIKQGEYSVQELVYYHLIKCFYNAEYGDQYSTLVNFDWYHPPYAYRFDADEIQQWFSDNKITILEQNSIEVQHYFLGQKA